MRSIVLIFFVPTSVKKPELETVLRQQLASRHPGGNDAAVKPDRIEIIDNDQWPLWTWFVPNPWP